MKKTIIIALTALLTTSLFAQRGSDVTIYTLNNMDREVDIYRESFGLNADEISKIEGSPYVNSSFLPGNIFQGDNLVMKNTMIRYNAYADEIEINQTGEKEKYGSLIKAANMYAKIGLATYVFVPFEGSVERGGYFEVVTDGKNFDLYKKIKSTYNAPRKSTSSYDRDVPASFTKTTTYYLVDAGGTFYELPSSKSKILNVMAKKKDEASTYIKKNNLNLDNEKDLAKLVTYFDSIL